MIPLDKLDDCFGKGLLRPGRKQPDLAVKDLAQARFFLAEAEDLLGRGKRVMASLALYNAYFHIVRALLFKDGYTERSHYCLARYLEERYVKEKTLDSRLLDAFETIMSVRHNAQYSTDAVEIEEDLGELSARCATLIERVEALLKKAR